MEGRLSRPLRRLLREPLVHFLLAGAALFAIFDLAGGPPLDRDDELVVTAADQRQLALVWYRQWRRPPTAEELAALVEAFIREEVLYREAKAMGLDQGDAIVRRRLAQKLEFLAADAAGEPTEPELARYFEQHSERFGEPERITFSHVYLSPERRGEAVATDALSILDALRRGEEGSGLGDRFMLQSHYGRRSGVEIDQLFGAGFAARLAELEIGEWQGPIASGYGLHLVRVEERIEPRLPALSEIRQRVRDELLAERARSSSDATYTRLRERYRVVVEEWRPDQDGSGPAPGKAAP